MNTSTLVRIVSATASVCITLAVFSGVASLAEPPQADAGTQLASAHSTAAIAWRAGLR